MRFRDGTFGQKAWFALLVGIYLASAALLAVKTHRALGRTDLGWTVDGWYVSPMRADAAAAGLRGGGRLIGVNGEPVAPYTWREVAATLKTEPGEVNTLRLRRPGGVMKTVDVLVRPRTLDDVIYAEGALVALGVFAILAGLAGFLSRPFQVGSWALLSFASLGGALLIHLPVNVDTSPAYEAIFIRALIGFVPAATFHVALALPIVHPWLRNGARTLWLIYLGGAFIAASGIAGWATDYAGLLTHVGGLDTGVLLLTMLAFFARCLRYAVRPGDPVVRQRARILVAGVILGGVPPSLVRFLQNTLGLLAVDLRVVYWALSVLLLAIAYTTVRYDLLNARVAVRRAVIYGGAMLVLTGLALLLIAIRPVAVAVLLLPLLYLWPRFANRVEDRLYPKRARFPALLRELGEEMAACRTADDVLRVLARAPARVADATSSVAFLLPDARDPALHVQPAGAADPGDLAGVAEEPLMQFLVATRRDVHRASLAVDLQFANIRDRSEALFDQLDAHVILPLIQGGKVAGGLAVGPQPSGDVYEPAELAAFGQATDQAVQALLRVEATERLRARELEFAELDRFLSPQIVQQVMEQGGAAGLASRRKLVTVFFADLRGFTSFSDRVEPEEVMTTLAEFHAAMGRRIAEHDGTLERFVGDGFMAFFNDPVEQPDHVARCARMALAMHADCAALRRTWQHKGYAIDVGMGIATGYATCGFVGYEGRRDYSVIGNVTNLAARLSDAAAGGDILVTQRVRGEAGDGFRFEPAGELPLKGFQQPQPAFRLLPNSAP